MAKRGQRKQITQGDPDPMDDEEEEEGGEGQGGGGYARADDSVIKSRRIVTARRRGGGGGGGGGGGAAASEPPKQEEPVQWNLGSFAPATGFGGTDPAAAAAAAAPVWGGGEFSFPPASSAAVTFGGGASSTFSFGGTTAGGEGEAQSGGFGFSGGFGGDAPGGFTGFGGAGSESGGFSFGGGGGGGEGAKEGEDGGESGGENPEEERVGFAPAPGAPVVEVQEVAVSTGEEGERQVFPGTRSKLLQFAEGRWQERGMGKVSVNVLEADESKARILFRAEQVGTIRLNVAVFPDMSPEIMAEKSVKFLGVADGKLSTFCVRFGKPSEAQSLHAELKAQIAKLATGQKRAPEVPAPVAAAPTTTTTATATATSGAEAAPKKAKADAPPVKAAESSPSPSGRAPHAKKTGGGQPLVMVPPKPGEEAAAVAVCVLEEQQIAGVVTLSRSEASPASVLVEATLEGLTPGRTYALELEGTSVARLTPREGPGARTTVAAQFASDSPIASFAGKRLSLSDGSSTKIVRPIKLDL